MATATAEPAPITNGTAAPVPESVPIPESTSTSASAAPEDNAAAASSGTKRKREDSPPMQDETAEQKPLEESSLSLQEVLRDVLKVLRKHDTTPSILTASLSKDDEDTSSSGEPAAKRTKLNKLPTIAGRIEDGEYTNLNALVEDVEGVIDELLTTVKTKEIDLPQTQYGRPSTLTAEETRLWTGTTKFQKLLEGIVQAEKERQKLVVNGKRLLKRAESAEGATVSQKIKVEEEEDTSDGAKPVLTLYANAMAPKQLFSSFQNPARDGGTLPPLRESGLPSFISTTNIAPLPADEIKKSRGGPTFLEKYGSSSEKYRLQPPKPSKTKLVTTGNTVEFVRIDGSVKPNKRTGYNYFSDKLTVGQWLGYGGVDTPQEPISPQAKRKQRDRALSSGEAFLPPSDAEKEALRKARNDALWRKCYSSFAPSYDDSTAIVPKDVRNEIWMDKMNERLASKSIVIDPALLDEPKEQTAEERKLEMEELKEFVDNFDPTLLEWDAEQQKKDKEMDDLLQEVSELLDTLASSQRIRNSTLSTNARTVVGQTSASDLLGTPTEPSAAEKEIYKTLKLQLAVLVNQLPPHAVAKLNGDQLEELNIKTSIVIEREDVQGVMAEDEATRAAKMQAYANASSSQTQAARPQSSNSYANYPASASQYNRTPAQQQPLRPSAASSYYSPGGQNQTRPGPIAYSRSSSGLQQSYSNNFPQNSSRPSYAQNYTANSFPRPGSTYQTPAANKSSYSQNYQHSSTPQQQQRPAHQQGTPSSSYQGRPAGANPVYGGYTSAQSPQARTNSPQVPASQSQYSQPQRQSFSTPVAGPTNPSYYRPPPPAMNATGTPQPGQSQYSNNYQAPNRVQQPGASAGMTPARQGSGTPQPPAPSAAAAMQMYTQTNGTGTTPAPAPSMLKQQSS